MKLILSEFIIISLLSMFFSCRKSVSPSPENVPPVSSTDTGINYNVTAVCDFNQDEAALYSQGWRKIFDEEFDGNLLKWNVFTGVPTGDDLQFYLPDNVRTTNGTLIVSARKENVLNSPTSGPFRYTSGRIESKQVFATDLYNPKLRISARVKVATGFGMTTLFMSYGTSWPTQGHINMLVASSKYPKTYSTNYYYGTFEGKNIVSNSFGHLNANEDLTACFHVYEMIWTKDELCFYLDDKLVEKKISGGYIPQLFGKEHHLSFYLAVNSDLISRPQINPSNVSVDWIKVFTANN